MKSVMVASKRHNAMPEKIFVMITTGFCASQTKQWVLYFSNLSSVNIFIKIHKDVGT